MDIGKIVLVLFFFIINITCTKDKSHIHFLPQKGIRTIENLCSCRDMQDTIEIDSNRPLTMFVHGCNSSGGIEFRALAQVFEFHGQQTICFNYDYRESMEKSSAELIRTLNQLSNYIGSKQITVIGHSQGGLVARRAFIVERSDGLKLNTTAAYRLVTISSPFAGINISEDCGKAYLHIATLGLTMGICQMIAGSKWDELYPESDFMESPGKLSNNVNYCLKIVTDERDACLKYNRAGTCVESDYVFSVKEQYNAKIDLEKRLANIEVKAGHIEIVGDENMAPKKLIAILQSNNILNETQPGKRKDLEKMLSMLY